MNPFKINKIFIGLLACSAFFWLSCDSKTGQLAKEVKQIPIEVEVIRFENTFFDSPISDFPKIQKEFSYLLSNSFDQAFWQAKMQDSLLKEVKSEVANHFPSDENIAKDLLPFFQYAKYYFPEESDHKKVITLVSEVDISSKAVYKDSIVFLALDTYLGEQHKYYVDFPSYMRTAFEPRMLLPDLAESFVIQKMEMSSDRTFVGRMIHQGKILYVKEQLLPFIPVQDIIGYSENQLKWAEVNEEMIWKYFLDNKMLFDTDAKLTQRFISTAPFSKFYLEIDNESPGQVGAWIGWQIVSTYMRNNNVTLQELLNKSEKQIFEESKYKPKR